jgi:hypothetical protein
MTMVSNNRWFFDFWIILEKKVWINGSHVGSNTQEAARP